MLFEKRRKKKQCSETSPLSRLQLAINPSYPKINIQSSPQCSLYIFYVHVKEDVLDNQELLNLGIASIILMTYKGVQYCKEKLELGRSFAPKS